MGNEKIEKNTVTSVTIFFIDETIMQMPFRLSRKTLMLALILWMAYGEKTLRQAKTYIRE